MKFDNYDNSHYGRRKETFNVFNLYNFILKLVFIDDNYMTIYLSKLPGIKK